MAYVRVTIMLLLISLLCGGLYFLGNEFVSFTIFIIGLLIVPVILTINQVKFTTKELVVLSLIGTIAAIFRIPFALLPSVQPTTFIIIATAICIGPQGGFIIGALAAFISNLYLGHGPWTIFQIIAWGLIGFYAGLLRRTIVMKSVIGRTIYGFMTGILFGWLMNLSFLIFFVQTIDWQIIIPYYIASFPFDLNHAITNSILLLLFSHVWIKLMSKHKLFNRK